ncbi:MAG TPA: His/Gly/Thr/Pro-type tRNA ligase C-terminal domain-containing protein, partial [Phycicoccus sp.]|nr:His/Gly/Thr/Pro-type tRNA ligase C-terminal domain-containing protein [Phycicoccus sp.]
DEHGKLRTVTMGSYGVGVTRAVACIAEGNHDEFGLVWPRDISPADVHIVATGKDRTRDPEVFDTAERLTRELEAEGLEVLYDDREKVSPGVKFKDSELIGVPTILVIGKSLENGLVEIKDRRSGDRAEVPVVDAVSAVIAAVSGGDR